MIKNQPFEITSEDYENSSGVWIDNYNCPLATAAKRTFALEPGQSIWVGSYFVEIFQEGKRVHVYEIERAFREADFQKLVSTKETFKTTISQNY